MLPMRWSIAVVGLLPLLALAVLANPPGLAGPPSVTLNLDSPAVDGLVGPDGRMHYFVELEGAPAAVAWAARLEAFSDKNSPAALAAAAAAAGAQVQANEAAQAAIAGSLYGGTIQAERVYTLAKVANGFVVRARPENVKAMGELPGVKTVHVVYPEEPFNSTSVPFIEAPPAWGNTLGLGVNLTGSGVKIGIIDTGIDYQHTQFGGTGVLADYTANDRTVAPDAFFPSAKVVGGWDFAGDTYNAGGNGGTTGSTTPVADPDPMDCNRHGTHVAGTAAGFGVNADGTTFAGPWDATTPFASLRIGPGVAPQAQLYALRVFGCQGSTSLTAQAIDWAADPNDDNDFSDHLDVINLSLGSNFGSTNELSTVAAENASLVGVMVVAASGNAGDTHFVTSSPGSASRALSVAASVDSGQPGASLTINSPAPIAGTYPAAASAYTNPAPPPPPAANGETANIVLVNDGSGTTSDACQSPFTNAAAIAGNIALLDRGTCNFNVKVQNAQANGAIGVIVANTTVGDPVPNVMGGAATVNITIPGISVSHATGAAIKAQLLGGPVNGTLAAGNGGDTMATFSSRGPRRTAPIKLKPEISAPGLVITSAQTGVSFAGGSCVPQCTVSFANAGNNAALSLNGTSMATPHMAGVMALMRQLHPTWTVEELKALVMNYANHDLFLGANQSGSRFGPGRVGAGRVDVADAAVGSVIAMSADDPGLVAVSFGTEVVGATTLTRNVRLVNHGSTAQTFDLAVDAVVDSPGVTITFPGGNSVTVPAGGTTTFSVQLNGNATTMDNAFDPTVATGQAVASPAGLAGLGTVARQRLREETGYLTFSQGGNSRFRLPYYSTPRPASQMSGASIVTGGAPSGSTTISLTGTDVCTGTLGAGPTCTGTFPTDVVSLVTPFELQFVSPQLPSLSNRFGDIQYAGVAADATGNDIYFGISTWDDWSTLNDVTFNIWIDNNEDGTWDFAVFTGSLGNVSARLFGSTENPQDNYLTYRFTPPSTVTSQTFVNASPAALETYLLHSNVLVIPVQAAGLGLNAGNNDFRWRVESCAGSRPLCSVSPAFTSANSIDHTGAGFATWNRTARGLDFGGTLLSEDLNGDSVPVTWNTANLAANGSLGALLLHHHNEVGRRAQVVLLDTASATDLTITQTATPPAPSLNQNVNLTLTVTNNGSAAASGIQVVDVLPSGLLYVSDDGGGAFSANTWTLPGNLAPAASSSLNIVATVTTTAAVTNVATISQATPLDPDPSDNQASVTLNAPENADLGLTEVASAPTVLVGNPVTFTLTATNDGADTAYGVAVNELFTSQEPVAPTTAVPSAGVYNGATGAWSVPSLGDGGSASLALTFTAPNMAGPWTHGGTSSSTAADANTANNNSSATVTVLSPATVSSTKTVSGTFTPGGAVTYSVTLTNSSAYDQQNNAGDEFTDVLPAQLTLVSAAASAGTATANLGTNTVTWNGVVPGGGSVTITIQATIDAGTELQVVSNQGNTSTDADGNGVNETTGQTDDPSVGGAADPTTFVVGSPATVVGTKVLTSNGPYLAGSAVTYEIVLTNTSAFTQLDNPGDEFVDILPAELTLTAAAATSGTVAVDLGTGTVTWNGSLAAAASVTITIEATISPFVGDGAEIANQGTIHFDGDGNGSNESSTVTDDPGETGTNDPTSLVVGNFIDVPVLEPRSLMALAGLLLAVALFFLRRF